MNELLIELQRQIDQLRAKVESLEAIDPNRFTNLYLLNDEAGLVYRVKGVTDYTDVDVEDFNVSALPAGFAWAGAPFITPAVVDWALPSHIRVGYSVTANERAFLYKTKTPSTSSPLGIFSIASLTAGFGVGIRIDDGSDNNYIEALYTARTTSPTEFCIHTNYRTGGGAVTGVDHTGYWYMPISAMMALAIEGTRWSSWSARPLLYPTGMGGTAWKNTIVSALSWTVSRMGIIFDDGGSTATWDRAHADMIYLSNT